MQQPVLVPLAILAVAVGVAILAVAAILVAAAVRRTRLRRTARPTGQVVRSGGTTLHVIRRGPAGGPTVVFIAGVGGVGASWSGIQDRLGDAVGSIAYDRAGLGWSGPARGPRTAEAMADELHGLLGDLEAPEPHVLVGHSLGGVIARQLAVRHPREVAGLVLVDSAHEEQYTRIPELERVVRRMSSMPGPAVRLMGALSAIRPPALETRLPAEAAEAVRAAMAVRPGHLQTAMAEMRSIALGSRPAGDLGTLPVVVLRHGRYERMPMLERGLNDRFEALFADLQAELAASSSRGRLVVADGSGHDVHLDRPDLVVDAIEEVLAMATSSVTGPEPHGPVARSGQATVPAAPAPIQPPRPVHATQPIDLTNGGHPMTMRIQATLAAIARPMLVLTGVLLAAGSILAAAGIAAGWAAYLAGYASAAITFPSIAAAHRDRLGGLGVAAFVPVTVAVVLGTPVVAMVATYVVRFDAVHLALMPYAMSWPGMVGALGVNLAVVLAGLALVRARVQPPTAGWLLAAAAILELPVELGLLPLPVWALAMVAVAVSFGLLAREPGTGTAPVRRLVAG